MVESRNASTASDRAGVGVPRQAAADSSEETKAIREQFDLKRREALLRGGAHKKPTFLAAGLEWQAEPVGPMSWHNANEYASRLSLPGGGWRLPTGDELYALFKVAETSPALNRIPGMTSEALYDVTFDYFFWDSSQMVRHRSLFLRRANHGNTTHFVRCVHGPAI